MAIKKITSKGISFEISYEILNPKKDKDVIFLHGWGSNKEIMKNAFSGYFRDFRHIYIDLPGFGKSENFTVLNTGDYKDIVEEFLKCIGAEKLIVFGHSFGGKIAVLLKPSFLVLLSSAGIRVEKPFEVRMKITLFKFLNSFGLGRFRKFFVSKDVKGMSENMYETFKNVVDEDFESVFSGFENPAVIFWGDEDDATPLICAEKIDSLMKNSKLHVLKGDHYFFLKYPQTIEKKITEEFYG